jgi:all-trans-retinol 13,14-reductase
MLRLPGSTSIDPGTHGGPSRNDSFIRTVSYETTKARIGENLLAQFKLHFPRLAPLIDFHETSTPLSQSSFVQADHGAIYGLEMSAERMGHKTLRIRTPVPGLLLVGQDAVQRQL